jgi:alpha-beta hydrolase superfamily lysophospholipase
MPDARGHRVPDEPAFVATTDGLRLAVWRRPPAGVPRRARLVLVHGYAEHAGRYGMLVDALCAAGHECVAFDLRGHGRSEGPRGHVVRFTDYLDDLDRVVHWAVTGARDGGRDAPGAPLIAVAHSLGGLIILEHARGRPGAFDAVAASSPFLAPAFPLPPLVEGLGALAARLVPGRAIRSALGPEALSHDAAVRQAYADDPMVFGTVTLGWWREVRAAQQALYERAGEVRLPALFLLGDADPVADCRRSLQVFERLGSADKRVEVYRGFLHEVLNEIGRERVLADLLGWLDARATPA